MLVPHTRLALTVLVIGTTLTFTAELKDSAGQVLTGRTIAWKSSDSAAVRISQGGPRPRMAGLRLGYGIARSEPVGRAEDIGEFLPEVVHQGLVYAPPRSSLAAEEPPG